MGLKLDLGIREGFLEEVVLSLRSRGWGREREIQRQKGDGREIENGKGREFERRWG